MIVRWGTIRLASWKPRGSETERLVTEGGRTPLPVDSGVGAPVLETQEPNENVLRLHRERRKS